MDHIGNRPNPVQRIEAVHTLGGIGHTDGDPVPPVDAHSDKRPGRQIHPAKKRGIVGLLSHELIGDVLGIPPRRVCEELVHSQVGIVNGFGRIAIKIHPGGGSRECHIEIILSGWQKQAGDLPRYLGTAIIAQIIKKSIKIFPRRKKRLLSPGFALQ